MDKTYYTQDDVDKINEGFNEIVDTIVNEHEKVLTERDDMIVAMRGVLGCMKSRTESGTCIEDHHPSCREYLAHILKRVTGR